MIVEDRSEEIKKIAILSMALLFLVAVVFLIFFSFSTKRSEKTVPGEPPISSQELEKRRDEMQKIIEDANKKNDVPTEENFSQAKQEMVNLVAESNEQADPLAEDELGRRKQEMLNVLNEENKI